MSGNSFFDMREKLGAGKKPRPGGASPLDKVFSVTQLTKVIDAAIRGGVPGTVAVQGEVSNFNFNRASGHAYFTLKDPNSCINCVMFRSEFERVKFKITDGLELLARGGVRVYAAQGKYQLYVESLQPLGRGALELAFQQLRMKLEAEGLFKVERKRPVPRFPARIVIVTSRETAALADMLKVLRRFPWIRLMLFHVPVQGEGCGRQIAGALSEINRQIEKVGGADVILLGRGGGSLEDLWGFNDESLARAIAASRLPIVTGIGHEVDVSIADLVADHHAHTPTEAARYVTAHWSNAGDLLQTITGRLGRQMRGAVEYARQRLANIQRHEVFRRPTNRIDDLRIKLDDRQQALQLAMHKVIRLRSRTVQEMAMRLERQAPAVQLARFEGRVNEIQGRLLRGMNAQMGRRVQRIDSASALLEAVSPQRVLQRGYSMTFLKKGGAIVRAESQVKEGDRLVTRLHDGEVESVVEDRKQQRLFE
jgi:exodeoxyribonuclease VII large subunit